MKEALTFLLVALLVLTGCATTDDSIHNDEGTITVSGRGEVTLEPDYGYFTVSAEVSGATTEEARERCADMMASSLSILKGSFNVEDSALKTERMNFWPEYRWEKDQRILTSQRAEQSVRVEIDDPAAIGEIYDALSEVDGIRLSGFTLDRRDKLKGLEDARRLAVEDALSKARTYADAAGLEITGIKSISSGAQGPVYENRVMYADAMPEAASAKGSPSSFYASGIKVADSLTLTVSTRVQ